MKKPPSRLKRILREGQLIASAGAAVAILYAITTSSLLLALVDVIPPVQGVWGSLVLSVLLSHMTLLVIVPLVCFGLCFIVDARPARLAFGAALLTECFLVALRFSAGGFDEEVPVRLLLGELFMTLVAGALGTGAGRAASHRVAARIAKEAQAKASQGPPAPDLADQLRSAQAGAPPAAPGPAAEPPKADPS